MHIVFALEKGARARSYAGECVYLEHWLEDTNPELLGETRLSRA